MTSVLLLHHPTGNVPIQLPFGKAVRLAKERLARAAPEILSMDDPFCDFVVAHTGERWELRALAEGHELQVDGSATRSMFLEDRQRILSGALEFEVRLHSRWTDFDDFCRVISKDGFLFLADRPPLQAYIEDHQNFFAAVVDASADEDIPRYLADPESGLTSLLQGRAARDLLLEAPYFAAISNRSEFALDYFDRGTAGDWGIILGLGNSDAAHTLSHLRSNLWASLNNDERLFFRFYDPRIAKDWIFGLDQAGRSSFFGDVIREVLIPCNGMIFHLSRSGRQRMVPQNLADWFDNGVMAATV